MQTTAKMYLKHMKLKKYQNNAGGLVGGKKIYVYFG